MATLTSHSPAETEALGESWGRAAGSGLVIGLCGGLGAGKTQLVRGLARGLGVPGRVHSPTFALINIYDGGRFTLFHLDLYRLETREQFAAAGLEEYLQPEGVTVIEWADRLFGSTLNSQHSTLNSQLSTLKSEVGGRRSEVQNPASSIQHLESSIENPPSIIPHPESSIQYPSSRLPLLWVRIETLNDAERLITYEDIGP